jgi:hypothetical protein
MIDCFLSARTVAGFDFLAEVNAMNKIANSKLILLKTGHFMTEILECKGWK